MADGQQQTFTDIQPIQQTFTDVAPIESPEEFRARVRKALPDVSEQMVNSVVKNPQMYKSQLPKDFEIAPPAETQPTGFIATAKQKLKGLIPADPGGGHSPFESKFWYDPAQAKFEPTGPGTIAHEALREIPQDIPVEQAYHAGKPIGRAIYRGASIASSLAGIDPESTEAHSERGDTGGVLAEAAVPATLAVAAPIAGRLAAPAADFAGKGARVVASGAKAVGRAAAETPLGVKATDFIGRTIPEEAVSKTPPSGTFQPALANTPKEVLQYAASKGIDLTPAQASGAGAARMIEAVGERSLAGGTALEEARTAQAQKLAQNIRNFADTVDPKAMGTSEEAAGDFIKQSADTAKQVRHSNASAAYDNIDWMSSEKVDPSSVSKKWMELRERLPMGVEEQIVNQVPRSMKSYVEEMLSPTGIKAPLTFDQSIALRSFFRELGDTDGLPNSQQGIFKQMSNAVDGAMEKTAEKIGGLKEWRDANQGWKDYTSLYGDKQSPLVRILKQNDPAKITRDILNRGSANDIVILKNEGMTGATDALKRQVVTDVANGGFSVKGDGLGGYSHSFLNSLFGEQATKELYLNGELARRFKFQVNPSGTSNVILGESQLHPGHPSKLMIPMGAAKASMPRAAASYLPESAAPAGGIRGAAPVAGLPPRAVVEGVKGTPFKYVGRSSSMGYSEIKDPATGISVTILDRDLDPAKIRAKIAAKLQEFGKAN